MTGIETQNENFEDFNTWMANLDDELFNLYEVVVADLSSDYNFQELYDEGMSVDNAIDIISENEELE